MSGGLRLADLLGGLSIVADLGFGLPPEQAMRSCLVAAALARKMNLTDDVVRDAFYVPLLMHVGCIGQAHEATAAFGDDLALGRAAARTNLGDPEDFVTTFLPELTGAMDAPARQRAAEFMAVQGMEFGRQYDTGACEVARATARRIGLPESTQQALYEIHEFWSGGWAPQGLAGDEIAIAARVVRAAAEAAFFDHIGDAALAVTALRQRAGVVLDPDIVDTFVADAPALLAEASAGDPRERILEVEPEPVLERHEGELAHVAAAFGDLADLKVPFLHGHSQQVARLAVGAAQRLGLDTGTIAGLEVAARLNDLGRVGISNAVWEKAGPLTSAEWEQVRIHAYHSERILATSGCLAPMAVMAGMHHERLDGSGYHRGSRGRDLSLPARLLAAADALSAMTQHRPHRPAMDLEAAAGALANEAHCGRLDGDAVSAVLDTAGQGRPRRPADFRAAGLSDREVEVLALVARGYSNPRIAESLFISRRTAEHHVQHIYAKIGVSTRAGAALFALEHDLLPAGPT